MTDKINPSYYRKGGLECIEAIKAITTGLKGSVDKAGTERNIFYGA